MKRDPRLRQLSSDHHQALVLSRALLTDGEAWTTTAATSFLEHFQQEIEPHFQIEESILLPALIATEAHSLSERAMEDHAFLRTSATLAGAGDGTAVRAFAERLHDHVRFEERELFPACEELLSSATLDVVAARCLREAAETSEGRTVNACRPRGNRSRT